LSTELTAVAQERKNEVSDNICFQDTFHPNPIIWQQIIAERTEFVIAGESRG